MCSASGSTLASTAYASTPSPTCSTPRGPTGRTCRETHEELKRLRSFMDENYENRMLIAEANQWPEDSAAYFGDGDECHMAFHFPLMPRLYLSLERENRLGSSTSWSKLPRSLRTPSGQSSSGIMMSSLSKWCPKKSAT